MYSSAISALFLLFIAARIIVARFVPALGGYIIGVVLAVVVIVVCCSCCCCHCCRCRLSCTQGPLYPIDPVTNEKLTHVDDVNGHWLVEADIYVTDGITLQVRREKSQNARNIMRDVREMQYAIM